MPPIRKTCPHCGREFVIKGAWYGRFIYCGMRCRRADTLRRQFIALEKMASKLNDKTLTPRMAANLRGEIAYKMREHISAANEVLAGTRIWTPVQAAIFKTLMQKVLPDLSASYVQKEVTNRNVKDLSISDLEAIVTGNAGHLEITHEPAQTIQSAPARTIEPDAYRSGPDDRRAQSSVDPAREPDAGDH